MKTLLKVAVVIVVLVVAALIAAVLLIDSIAKTAIERGGTHALGVTTTVGGADVGILSAEMTLDDVDVANPSGFPSEDFLTLGDGSVSVSLASLREDIVEVPRLVLSDIVVNLEKSGGKSNYDVILENLRRFERTEDGAPPAEEEAGKKFVVREIVIRDVLVNVNLLPIGGAATKVDVPVDEVVMKDVGRSGEHREGLTIGELSGLIVKAVLLAAIESGAGVIPAHMMADITGRLGDLEGLGDMAVTIGGEAIGNLERIFGDIQHDAGDTIKEGIDDVREGIGDLLGGDEDDEGSDQDRRRDRPRRPRDDDGEGDGG